MAGILFYFVVGLVVCLIGTIPFGPINLTVVKTTVDLGKKCGFEVALAASLIEIFEALIAISFGAIISIYLETNLLISLAIAIAFIVLGIIVLTNKPKANIDNGSEYVDVGSQFRKGVIVATLNPQAIPYWIFALAAISQYFVFEYTGLYLIGFLSGVFVGKLLALYGFIIMSDYLKTHVQQSSLLVNRLLAGVLIAIGISQSWRALLG